MISLKPTKMCASMQKVYKPPACLLTFILVHFFVWGSLAYALPNEISYTIEATLDTQKNIIMGHEEMSFTNKTGHDLSELYFHAYPNAFKRGSNSQYQKDLFVLAGIDPIRIYANPSDDAFLEIKSVQADGRPLTFYACGAAAVCGTTADDTLMRVALDEALKDGETINLKIEFVYDLMEASAEALWAASLALRSGHRNGVYTIALWYPKVVVYDARGWNLEPYRYIGEFYGDFGDYFVELTVPEELIVGSTGELLEERPNPDETKTLAFKAERAHDFAWVASSRFQIEELIWNGILVRTLYLNKPFMGEMALDVIQYFSEQFGLYGYKQLTVAQVTVGGGMEYPAIVMIAGGSEVEMAHEIAHQWWYGAVGNDETTEAWLDEAFSVFSEELFKIKRRGLPLSSRSSFYFREPGIPVLTSANQFPSLHLYFEAVYRKGSGVLWMLQGLLGEEVFIKALQTYYERFKYKNATTPGFVAVVEEASKQKLDWFFEQWLRTTKTLDFFIDSVSIQQLEDGSFLNGFTVKRAGEAVMPVRIALFFQDGTKREEQWDGLAEAQEFSIKAGTKLIRIVIDPDAILLEENRANNAWNSSQVLKLTSLQVTVYHNLLTFWRG